MKEEEVILSKSTNVYEILLHAELIPTHKKNVTRKVRLIDCLIL